MIPISLSIKELAFAYAGETILKDVSFELQQGEIVTIVGASGSGKTTLFKLIAGLLTPSKGQIVIHGKNPPLTFMMQEDLLLPWRNVLSNTLLSGELGKSPMDPARAKEAALKLLEEVGLSSCTEKFPTELSGGMRQRVALARALLPNRPILLLDEPFGALDVALREQLYDLLRDIQRKYDKTILLITHDFRDALFLSDRVLLLANGKIENMWNVTPEIRADGRLLSELQDAMRESLGGNRIGNFNAKAQRKRGVNNRDKQDRQDGGF